MSPRFHSQVESILGYDFETRRKIGEATEDDVLDSYRDLIAAATTATTLEDLMDAIAVFLESFGDEHAEEVEALFTALLKTQILSDDVKNLVSKAVQESIRKPRLDGRQLCEDLESIQVLHRDAYKKVKMSRSFPEACQSMQAFIDALKGINQEVGASVQEDLIRAMMDSLKAPELAKDIKHYAKVLIQNQDD